MMPLIGGDRLGRMWRMDQRIIVGGPLARLNPAYLACNRDHRVTEAVEFIKRF